MAIELALATAMMTAEAWAIASVAVMAAVKALEMDWT